MASIVDSTAAAPEGAVVLPGRPAEAAGAAATFTFPPEFSVADLLAHLGGIPSERVRLVPPPGYATADDVVRLQESKTGLCELIDGVLVEKTMGVKESNVAVMLIHFLQTHVLREQCGFVLSTDGPVKTTLRQVRMPDVCFVSWDRCPNGEMPSGKIVPFSPDLAVEVISEGNTKAEMDRKLQEYFEGGTRLAWYIDPATRTARVYRGINDVQIIGDSDFLDGGDVLPGFQVRLEELFQGLRKMSPPKD